jgi:hypothetical protein
MPLVLLFVVEIWMEIMPWLCSQPLDHCEGQHVPKLINVQHPQHTTHQAQEYVKTYIVLPSGFLGLICVIGAVGGLGYQWLSTDSYTWDTFYQSSGLFLSGVGLGAAQTLYQRYLLREFPEVLAARMKEGLNRQKGKLKKRSDATTIEHPGRQFVPLAYLLGVTLLVGSTIAVSAYGRVSLVPALLMPWAGFYWARLFLWRRVITVEKAGR